mgnify:CR=1 FL=1
MFDGNLRQIDTWRWEVPQTGRMRVPGVLYASRKLLQNIGADEGIKQVVNVACLPGIVKASLAMPDMHWGYGFPIGGVAAFDLDEGIISPGGVGYDINCGCRMMTTRLFLSDIQDRLKDMVVSLFHNVPSGVGVGGNLRLAAKEVRQVLTGGSAWAVNRGFGEQVDLETTEDGGVFAGADPDLVSDLAISRGKDQLGTLGSGNHFLEIEVVEEIFEQNAAAAFGLEKGQICVMIHSGSRGLGYQICDDYLAEMVKHAGETGIELPDRQLACAKINSERGKRYFSAMACAANYAWVNRQLLMYQTKEAFQTALGISPRSLGMRLLYDICHNIAKIEELPVEGKNVRLCVHRKGATRAYPAGHPVVPVRYRDVGQPVLIPGDMGTGSYVLVGSKVALMETFGSACHGAGRVMSRTQARKSSRGKAVAAEMAKRGVLVMSSSRGTLQEEIPEAYKNLDDVVEVVHSAGLARKVAKLRALGCVKG